MLDTNVVVSGVFWRGPASRILELSMGRVADVELLSPSAFLRRYIHMR